jgi:inosine-uridine nucleoside N-ribohydrolase
VLHDIESAKQVFAAPWEITIAPLDVCGTLRLTGGHFREVAESRAPRAAAVMENYRQWANFKQYPEGESSVLFDTVAVYLCHSEAWVDMETLHLRVDDQGVTAESAAGRPVRCALRWKDEEAFKRHLVDALK